MSLLVACFAFTVFDKSMLSDTCPQQYSVRHDLFVLFRDLKLIID